METLCKWSEKWQMKFNIAKCKVKHIRAKNSGADYKMENTKLDKITEEKDLELIISRNLKVGKQCAKAASKGNQILGLLKRMFISKKKTIILNLNKSLVRPHLQYCFQAWRPHMVKGIFWRRCKRGLRE